MNSRFILFLIIGIDAFILFLETFNISISYHEAQQLYDKSSALNYIIKTSLFLFGQNDFALRTPMIFLHLLSLLLLYQLSKKYINDFRNRVWLMVVFVLLPGVISSALLVDSAGLLIFGLLLFVYIFENYDRRYSYILLGVYSLLDPGFLYLFIALTLFGIYKKDKLLGVYNLLLSIVSVLLYGYDTQGLPKGHFLDAVGIYSTIFTPIIFIYIFYVLYRRIFTRKVDLSVFVSVTVLILSLLLSFRQRIEIEHFAPYLIISLPVVAQTFITSYRVRLKQFRSKYKAIFIISLGFLIVNAFLLVCSKYLYYVIDVPKENFAYKFHVAKELAQELKRNNINCIEANKEISLRLRFYGIQNCNTFKLQSSYEPKINEQNVTISYFNRTIYKAYVTKGNNN